MSSHAHKTNEEVKKHGDVLEQAMHDADRHTIEGANADPVPTPENGSHSRSQAAHLGTAAHEHTKPAGTPRHDAVPGERRDPPRK